MSWAFYRCVTTTSHLICHLNVTTICEVYVHLLAKFFSLLLASFEWKIKWPVTITQWKNTRLITPMIEDSNPEPATGRDSLVWRWEKMVKKLLIKISKWGFLYFQWKGNKWIRWCKSQLDRFANVYLKITACTSAQNSTNILPS
jgi:hypothetical protein